MDENDIQEFADKNRLDVREVNPWQLRLMNEYGKYILDIYIKKNKIKTKVLQNRVLKWSNEKWYTCTNPKELQKLI